MDKIINVKVNLKILNKKNAEVRGIYSFRHILQLRKNIKCEP